MNVNLEMYIQIINPVTMRQNQCYFRLKKKIKGRRKKLKNRLKDKLLCWLTVTYPMYLL